ncbi:MAG: hypothetical protein H0Z19_05175 [Archaeoglobus sp.]|uniref:hypothetical protein n=1 Tax=Archaeoglobus sp. TaxID=1872626 RepID=UPI001DEFE268|nr:hypothetical protein [Archaeoglobus sp.]MBO8179859.1 hypothetical protein [Archaeoglobus sp.]
MMEEVVVSGLSEQKRPEPKICPLRALAYTIAGVPAKVQEPVCIGPRCAWYIPVGGLGRLCGKEVCLAMR